MTKPVILCIDDQREILATLNKELNIFRDYFTLSFCESADEAQALINEIEGRGEHLAIIICDHVMPGKSGIDFLSELKNNTQFPDTKILLLTGLATHEDTIDAINNAKIDYYVEKPWDTDQFIDVLKKLATEYIIDTGLNYTKYTDILDNSILFKKIRRQ